METIRSLAPGAAARESDRHSADGNVSSIVNYENGVGYALAHYNADANLERVTARRLNSCYHWLYVLLPANLSKAQFHFIEGCPGKRKKFLTVMKFQRCIDCV